MVAGIFVLAAPVAVLAGAGVGVATHLKNKQLKQEKVSVQGGFEETRGNYPGDEN